MKSTRAAAGSWEFLTSCSRTGFLLLLIDPTRTLIQFIPLELWWMNGISLWDFHSMLVLTSKLGKAYPRPSPSSYPNQMSSPFRPNSMPVGSESRIQLLNLTHETQSDYVDLNLTIRERSQKDPFLFWSETKRDKTYLLERGSRLTTWLLWFSRAILSFLS